MYTSVTQKQNDIRNIDHNTSVWQANIPVTRWHIANGTDLSGLVCQHHRKTKYSDGTITCD